MNVITFDPPLRLDDFTILFLGRSGLNVSVIEHMHGGYYELTIVRKGSGKMYTGKVAQTVKQGDVYISFPFDVHKIDSNPDDPMLFDFITFSVNSFKFADRLNALWNNKISPDTRVMHSERVLNIIDSIIDEFDENDINSKPMSTEILSALCNQMIIHILRDLKSDGEIKAPISKSNSELCRKMMNYIDTNIYNIKSLYELSDALGYNYSYLSAVFKKATTLSLSVYYRAKRLETARLLISERNMSISKIAELLGYSSIYAFSKSFKEHYGISPREFLKQEFK